MTDELGIVGRDPCEDRADSLGKVALGELAVDEDEAAERDGRLEERHRADPRER